MMQVIEGTETWYPCKHCGMTWPAHADGRTSNACPGFEGVPPVVQSSTIGADIKQLETMCFALDATSEDGRKVALEYLWNRYVAKAGAR